MTDTVNGEVKEMPNSYQNVLPLSVRLTGLPGRVERVKGSPVQVQPVIFLEGKFTFWMYRRRFKACLFSIYKNQNRARIVGQPSILHVML